MKHIPNFLSGARLILSLIILILFSWINNLSVYYIVVILTAFAGITDLLDGWLARKFNWVSDLGKNLDPWADKALVIIYIPLTAIGAIGFVPVGLLFFRDISVTVMRSQCKKTFPAIFSGKFKTVISFPLMVAIIACLPIDGRILPSLSYYAEPIKQTGNWLLSLVCVWSFFDYTYHMKIKKND